MQDRQTLHLKKEEERIAALKKYAILDTPPDGNFDKITKLAAQLLKVPIAIVTLVDTDRIWFKSRYGIDVNEIGRDPGLCSSAILSDDLYIVEDAIKDPRTLANPLVAGDFGLRFYAAVPLKVRGGHNLGTLCVIDKHPRQLDEAEKEILGDLADILIDQIELRLEARRAVYRQNEMLNIAAHDMKNPLTIIRVSAELISDEKTDFTTIEKLSGKIADASTKVLQLIDDLLDKARKEATEVELNRIPVNLADFVEDIIVTNKVLAGNKQQELQLDIESRPLINADPDKLGQILDNVVNNAVKYSSKNTTITVTVRQASDKAIVEVKDQGPGFSEEDKKNLFQRFARLSNKPTGGEQSSGLGLSIVKALVQAHNGSVTAESEGKGKGATFTIEFPVF